jgi:hypothetical protein
MRGLLLVLSEPVPAHEEEFNAWYDLEHIPERAAIPGFGACRRWIAADGDAMRGQELGGRYLASYELESREVLDGPAYRARAYDNMTPWGKRVAARLGSMRRWMARETGRAHATLPAPAQPAGALFVSIGDIPAEHEEDFNRWYDDEHVPMIAAIPGVLRARRWRATEGTPRYIALYELAGLQVREHPGWKSAAGTPWTARIRAHQAGVLRTVRTFVPLAPVKGP